jgi:hypothetical protein
MRTISHFINGQRVTRLGRPRGHFHWAKSGKYVTQVTAIGALGLEYHDLRDDPRHQHVEAAFDPASQRGFGLGIEHDPDDSFSSVCSGAASQETTTSTIKAANNRQ